MSNHLHILKRALEDPKLKGLTCICSSQYSILDKHLDRVPEGGSVSEWRYGNGSVFYEYRVHKKELSRELKQAFDEGARGGHPKLTAVYSRIN